MAKKYYGVRKGREVGVFTNWDEVSRLVTGFKGAEFKGFTNKREVSEYMGIPYIEEDKSPTAINKNKCIEEKTADDLIFE